jgi:ABC-type phosphate transport system substrate-binding protein
MNKQMKQHLTTVVTAIVNEDTAGAKEAFREYVSLKTQAILLGEESKDDEEVDKDLDKDEKDVKDDEKDSKKVVKDVKKTEKDVKKTKKDQKKDEEKCEECGKMPCTCD